MATNDNEAGLWRRIAVLRNAANDVDDTVVGYARRVAEAVNAGNTGGFAASYIGYLGRIAKGLDPTGAIVTNDTEAGLLQRIAQAANPTNIGGFNATPNGSLARYAAAG